MELSDEKVNNLKREFEESSKEMLSDAKELVEDFDQRVRTVVREHPFLTLFGALVGGYAVGRLLARR